MGELVWAWTEVDLSAIAANVRALRKVVGPRTRMMAVVKADGYGHGAVQAANAALAGGAHRLAVATVPEGIELRDAGITAPIQLCQQPPPASADAVVRHRLIPAVYDREFALALSGAAQAAGATAEYHLKIDTGLNRIGVRAEDAADVARSLIGLPGIALEGVFTHPGAADVPGDWETTRQFERFDAAIDSLRTFDIHPGIIHAANSASAILAPSTRYDMVRCGIAIYGLHPGEATRGIVDLKPAMAVKARITQVKRIGMGEGVSYGFTWHAASPTMIATLPLGYADGVSRGLSNKMKVLVGGVECPQVGRVCMDQIMVELPRGCDAREGDEAVVVGEQGGRRLGLDDQAGLLDTISYELACGYGRRLERRFVSATGRAADGS